MNILFLTTHNLATNPRLVKEIQLALKSGFSVQVICFEFDNWSKEINERLEQELSKAKIISIPAGRKPLLPWLRSETRESFCLFAGKLFPLQAGMLSQAVSRRSNLLIDALSKVSKPDWVIGHNPGAMWPAIKASERFNCKVGFDVEDYHPGEGQNKYLQKLSKQLMADILPKMNYVSFASPLIMQKVKNDINEVAENWFTVLNYFPSGEFLAPVTENSGPLKMIWFSQNINAGRGLELVLPFVKEASDTLELHLIGNLNRDFYNTYLKDISNIIVYEPMAQKELHHSLARFDIGLALEPAKDKNNELAISNKILAYLQAGLFVMATNTAAQENLLMEFPAHGLCFEAKASEVQSAFEKIVGATAIIRSQKKSRYKAFINRNWENASLCLLNLWNRIN